MFYLLAFQSTPYNILNTGKLWTTIFWVSGRSEDTRLLRNIEKKFVCVRV